MDVIPLLVFCSLVLGALGVLAFLYSVRQGDSEHADRLSLLPLEEDASPESKKGESAGEGGMDPEEGGAEGEGRA